MAEEKDALMRRGALLEDGALLMPVVRKKQGVPAGSGCLRAGRDVASSEIWEV